MLWLCLHFHRLSVEVFTRGSAVVAPLVVTVGKGTRRSVFAVNAGAAASGIRPGLGLGAAHALAPDLCVRERDLGAEGRALAGLAVWAGQFTSWVSLAPPALLLEVEGSLDLFEGLSALVPRVEEGVRGLGYRASSAVAPTPLAAELLARAGRKARVTELSRLEEALAPLKLGVLGLPKECRNGLYETGLHSFNECLKQPRDGIVRRFGSGFLDTLDRALGRLPDPRPPFVSPPRFASRLELPAEVSSTESLLFAAHRLILELEGFLRARGSGVQRFCLELFHREGDPTRVEVGLASAGRDPRRLLALLRERLERAPLPAPVGSVALTASDLLPLVPRERDLFARDEGKGQDGSLLLERLRARLGDGAVQGLRLVEDHRPERAFQWVAPSEEPAERARRRRTKGGPASSAEKPPRMPRPLWLLPEPAPLSERGFSLLCGPERIESGWWDGGDAARDYFVAEDSRGSRLWVYRERQGERRWFVHGIFG